MVVVGSAPVTWLFRQTVPLADDVRIEDVVGPVGRSDFLEGDGNGLVAVVQDARHIPDDGIRQSALLFSWLARPEFHDDVRHQSVPQIGARYSSSVTFSIQVTGDPFTDSWMAMWVMASCGGAPGQCLCSAGHQRMSPAWNSSFGPPSIWVQPTPSVTIRVCPAGCVCHTVRAPGSK